MFISYLMK